MTYINSNYGQFISTCGPISTHKTVLTSAQVKALKATPVVVLPAKGAGKQLYITRVCAKLTYGGNNPFTNPQNLFIYQSGNLSNNITPSITGTGFINQSANYYNQTTSTTTQYLTDNTDLTIANVSASEITGNAANDNTLTIVVYYQVVTI